MQPAFDFATFKLSSLLMLVKYPSICLFIGTDRQMKIKEGTALMDDTNTYRHVNFYSRIKSRYF